MAEKPWLVKTARMSVLPLRRLPPMALRIFANPMGVRSILLEPYCLASVARGHSQRSCPFPESRRSRLSLSSQDQVLDQLVVVS